MPSQYFVAFWNLENLFDIEESPRRSQKLMRALGRSLSGWTQEKLERKVFNLASIIVQMNGGRGPDMLGVCEVENKFVMNLLVQALAPLGRNYAVAHHDTDDRRGIDVGFIYDADLFRVEMQFNHFVLRRTATRDILQVNYLTPHDRRFVVIANHWPSRSGGALESAGYRMIAGETLAYFHERILEVHGKDTPVLAMGDFNDEPFDASLVRYALGVNSLAKVINARSARFYNLMWPLMGQGLASFYYNNFPNMLDQFLGNKNLIKKSGDLQALPETVEILRFPEMVSGGDYPAPIHYGGMGKVVNPDGFSDHYPVAVVVEERE
jgi:hypothetical protein